MPFRFIENSAICTNFIPRFQVFQLLHKQNNAKAFFLILDSVKLVVVEEWVLDLSQVKINVISPKIIFSIGIGLGKLMIILLDVANI